MRKQEKNLDGHSPWIRLYRKALDRAWPTLEEDIFCTCYTARRMVFLRDSLVALIPRLTSSPHIVIETKSNHLKKRETNQKIWGFRIFYTGKFEIRSTKNWKFGIFKTEKFEIRTSNIEKLKTRKSQKIENVLNKKKNEFKNRII